MKNSIFFSKSHSKIKAATALKARTLSHCLFLFCRQIYEVVRHQKSSIKTAAQPFFSWLRSIIPAIAEEAEEDVEWLGPETLVFP